MTSPPPAASGDTRCGMDPSEKRAGSISACPRTPAAEANRMTQLAMPRTFMPRFYAIVAACTAVTLSAQPQRPASAPFDLEEATVAQLQARMEAGQDTARTLVDKYIARIQAVDRSGPQLKSVLEINPDAQSIADSLDAERKAGRVRGPLHGIPVLIKDNIATRDRMMTTAGSLALEGSQAPQDAFIVGRLRAAGVVILGKTNLSEWANFRSTHSSSGW